MAPLAWMGQAPNTEPGLLGGPGTDCSQALSGWRLGGQSALSGTTGWAPRLLWTDGVHTMDFPVKEACVAAFMLMMCWLRSNLPENVENSADAPHLVPEPVRVNPPQGVGNA